MSPSKRVSLSSSDSQNRSQNASKRLGYRLLKHLSCMSCHQLAEWRIKVGFYWLLLSWFSLFLTFVIWVGTPVSAFTNACEACDNPALCAKDYACVQLNGGLCPPSEKEKGAWSPLCSSLERDITSGRPACMTAAVHDASNAVVMLLLMQQARAR